VEKPGAKGENITNKQHKSAKRERKGGWNNEKKREQKEGL